jgi:hypothetical protein
MRGMVMVRAHSALTGDDAHPPMVLVHGPANSRRVSIFWQGEIAHRGWSSHAIDLHGTSAPAELATTRMATTPTTSRRSPVACGSDEGKADVVVRDTPRPVLIVIEMADMQWARQRYDDLPFGADHIEIVGASHWRLVLNRRLLPGSGRRPAREERAARGLGAS